MARPANAQPERTRQLILDAATPLFAERGFSGASTREIAAKARVNIATLNYYFGSKQGIYDAAIGNVYARLDERAQRALLTAPLPRDVGEAAGRMYEASRAERDGVRLLMRQVVDRGRLAREIEQKYFLPGVARLSEFVAAAFGTPLGEARAAVIAAQYLISRYVIQDDDSLKVAFDVRSVAEAHRRVVETLATTARALVSNRGGARPSGRKLGQAG